jgi:hypothetical protein
MHERCCGFTIALFAWDMAKIEGGWFWTVNPFVDETMRKVCLM